MDDLYSMKTPEDRIKKLQLSIDTVKMKISEMERDIRYLTYEKVCLKYYLQQEEREKIVRDHNEALKRLTEEAENDQDKNIRH